MQAFRLPWVRIGVAVFVLVFVTPLLLQTVESPDSAYQRYFDGVYFTLVTMSTVQFDETRGLIYTDFVNSHNFLFIQHTNQWLQIKAFDPSCRKLSSDMGG
jgi:hypothetical protein